MSANGSPDKATVELYIDSEKFRAELLELAALGQKTADEIKRMFEGLTASGLPMPIASLEPGKLYVIKADFHRAEDLDRFSEQLKCWAPEVKFLILPARCELVTTIPETDAG